MVFPLIIIHTYYTPFTSMSHCYRPNWILCRGIRYVIGEYLFIGWQPDDLPLFGQIQQIIIIENSHIMFLVLQHVTLGTERHYHSYVMKRSSKLTACWYSELVDYQPLQAHYSKSSCLYVTLRSHVENTNLML